VSRPCTGRSFVRRLGNHRSRIASFPLIENDWPSLPVVHGGSPSTL
jgi:hypothetical protein